MARWGVAIVLAYAAVALLTPLPEPWSRWLQAPLYIGLIVAQGLYVWQFWHELWLLIQKMGAHNISETEIMLIVLGLIDLKNASTSAMLLPVIPVGFLLGFFVLRKINIVWFRRIATWGLLTTGLKLCWDAFI